MADEELLDREKLAVLMTTQSEPEANIVKGILEESGIDCVLVTPMLHSIYPFTVDGLAAIQIKVLDSKLETAQELLRDYEADADEPLEGDPDKIR